MSDAKVRRFAWIIIIVVAVGTLLYNANLNLAQLTIVPSAKWSRAAELGLTGNGPMGALATPKGQILVVVGSANGLVLSQADLTHPSTRAAKFTKPINSTSSIEMLALQPLSAGFRAWWQERIDNVKTIFYQEFTYDGSPWGDKVKAADDVIGVFGVPDATGKTPRIAIVKPFNVTFYDDKAAPSFTVDIPGIRMMGGQVDSEGHILFGMYRSIKDDEVRLITIGTDGSVLKDIQLQSMGRQSSLLAGTMSVAFTPDNTYVMFSTKRVSPSYQINTDVWEVSPEDQVRQLILKSQITPGIGSEMGAVQVVPGVHDQVEFIYYTRALTAMSEKRTENLIEASMNSEGALSETMVTQLPNAVTSPLIVDYRGERYAVGTVIAGTNRRRVVLSGTSKVFRVTLNPRRSSEVGQALADTLLKTVMGSYWPALLGITWACVPLLWMSFAYLFIYEWFERNPEKILLWARITLIAAESVFLPPLFSKYVKHSLPLLLSTPWVYVTLLAIGLLVAAAQWKQPVDNTWWSYCQYWLVNVMLLAFAYAPLMI